MAKNRFRLRYTFWLDLLKSDEQQLSDDIVALKEERSFAATIRDGIRLVLDLREGRVDVLCELFPWVKDKLQLVPAPGNNDLKQDIEILKQLMMAKSGDDLLISGVGRVPITNRTAFAQRPSITSTPLSVVEEVDTSEAFLNAF